MWVEKENVMGASIWAFGIVSVSNERWLQLVRLNHVAGFIHHLTALSCAQSANKNVWPPLADNIIHVVVIDAYMCKTCPNTWY